MTEYHSDPWLTVYQGDCREVMAAMEPASVHCVVTSPPYWGLRDYGSDGQLGLEATPEAYVAAMVEVFRAVRRVLRDDGTVWLNLGDSYAPDHAQQRKAGWKGEGPSGNSGLHAKTGGSRARDSRGAPAGLKPKDLVGIPWRVAFALQADGWYLRSDIIWAKPNPMPESVTDRPTKAHEYLFLLSKSPRYYFDADAVREPHQWPGGSVVERGVQAFATAKAGPHGQPDRGNSGGFPITSDGRNLRSVWTIATAPYPGAHFATFPPKLVEPCVKAGCPPDGIVLDPFAGSGTTGMVAQSLGRRAVLIDLNGDYLVQAMTRNANIPLGLEIA